MFIFGYASYFAKASYIESTITFMLLGLVFYTLTIGHILTYFVERKEREK